MSVVAYLFRISCLIIGRTGTEILTPKSKKDELVSVCDRRLDSPRKTTCYRACRRVTRLPSV